MKRLFKIRHGKKLFGVCGGFGEYFDINPNIIRLAFVLFAMLAGSGILAYAVAALAMPYEDEI